MKKAGIVLLAVLFITLTACGTQAPSQESALTEPNANVTAAAPEDEALPAAETAEDLSTAPTEAIPETESTEDWKAAYIDFLTTWKTDNKELDNTAEAEYSFVQMQGIKNPVLVLFDGGRQCSLYVYENGKVSAVPDQEGADLSVLVRMPVYLSNDHLYFFGGAGSPAVYEATEVYAKDNTLVSETIASAVYASSRGDKDYFYGRDNTEITESEYNTIVDGAKANAKEVEFFSLANME